LGAGSFNSGSGYHADKINDNSAKIVSPHIIAGFLPVNPAGKEHLLSMYRAGKGRYELPLGAPRFILWRYSINSPVWTPSEIQGIDYSSMLFGLASLPEYLGPEFFSTYNNFFDFALSIEGELASSLKVYPNPSRNQVHIELEEVHVAEFRLFDLLGREIDLFPIQRVGEIILDVSDLEAGLYLLKIKKGDAVVSRKIFVED